MLTVAEVWEKLDTLVAPLPPEQASLIESNGRILRETVFAPEDQPAFDRASIDGFAMTAATPAGATLRLAGEVAMGSARPKRRRRATR
jgi:molybdopterin biosynthesis enzyme